MRSTLFVLLALASTQGLATEHPDLALTRQLAAHPLALVQGDQCEIRGAVWAGGPRAGVNVELLDGVNTYPAKTNAAGIWSVSIPFDGQDIALIERVADPILVPEAAKHTATQFKPAVLCSRELTAQILSQL